MDQILVEIIFLVLFEEFRFSDRSTQVEDNESRPL